MPLVRVTTLAAPGRRWRIGCGRRRLGQAFRGDADFSGVNGVHPPDSRALLVSAVLHTAMTAIDEDGTSAWAVDPQFGKDHARLTVACVIRLQAGKDEIGVLVAEHSLRAGSRIASRPMRSAWSMAA